MSDLDPGLTQVANRLARVQRHIRKWARRTGTTCWRVYEKDIPDQPLIVDWYDGDAVVWALDRTRNETPAQEEAWIAGVLAAVAQGLVVAPERIWLKRRRRQKDRHKDAGERADDEGQYEAGPRRGVVRAVVENGCTFEVNFSDYLDVGLFLDHRPLRQRVGADAAGKRVLNLFAYTGAFTIHARAGGAAATTTVDLSNTYQAWTARNCAINGMAITAEHALVRADCLAWLDAAAAGGPRWDVIVCDPPTFSASTAMHGRTWSVDRDHPWLFGCLWQLIRPGGTVWFSTNSRGFQLAASGLPAFQAEECSTWTVPEDFRNRKIHRCWRLVRPG